MKNHFVVERIKKLLHPFSLLCSGLAQARMHSIYQQLSQAKSVRIKAETTRDCKCQLFAKLSLNCRFVWNRLQKRVICAKTLA
jgi:hypothetical protein